METESTLALDGGDVTVIKVVPDGASAMLVMSHGAGADIRHQHMASICEALATRDIATWRFNLPYMERGGGRTDRPEVCVAAFDAAVKAARPEFDLPLLVGGHSFGGRMSTHFAATHSDSPIAGVMCFSFPLHQPKKPDTKRAAHLPDIQVPVLFLSGTRDGMADEGLLESVAAGMPDAVVARLETADHGFKILKRTRTNPASVYDEAAEAANTFVSRILAGQ